MNYRTMRLSCGLILFALAGAIPAVGQPASLTRVLRVIDFEERRLGNQEELPMHWVKVEASGFPHYVQGRLADDRARSASHSFRFELNGGSLLYRYDPSEIGVTPGACYRVEAWGQTTPLEQSRARGAGTY